MKICNELVSESFSYQKTGEKISTRANEIELLDEIVNFCKKIDEKVVYDNAYLWDIEVEENLTMYSFLFEQQNDVQMLLLEIINKRCKPKNSEKADKKILCSCGKYDGAADCMDTYKQIRQEYLMQIKNCRDYTSFMRTCFPNCVFSKECDQEFLYIKEFDKYVEEITRGLSILDSNAVTLFEKYKNNLKLAMDSIEATLGRSCSLDPKHKKFLNFPFSYAIEQDREIIQKEKQIECQPHLKLIRDDSNLRIYFYWKDDEIEDGQKVLIGRVGRHPWKK